jgi:hypothetical protein
MFVSLNLISNFIFCLFNSFLLFLILLLIGLSTKEPYALSSNKRDYSSSFESIETPNKKLKPVLLEDFHRSHVKNMESNEYSISTCEDSFATSSVVNESQSSGIIETPRKKLTPVTLEEFYKLNDVGDTFATSTSATPIKKDNIAIYNQIFHKITKNKNKFS